MAKYRVETDQGTFEIETDDQPAKEYSIGQFASNAIRSGGNFARGIGSAIAHPLDTASNLGQVAFGAIEKPVRAGMEAVTGRTIAPTPEEQKTDALINSYKERYRSGLLDAAYEDPFGVAGDVSTVAGGAAGILGNTSKVGRAAATVSKVTNPTNLVSSPVQLLRAVGGKLAEHGMGIAAKDRLYGKTPGRGILDETGAAITPAGVVSRADDAMTSLTAELEAKAAAAGKSGVKTNIGPARKIADDLSGHHGEGINQGLGLEIGDMAQSLRKVPSKAFHGATEYLPGAATPITPGRMNPFTGQRGPTSRGVTPDPEIAAMQSPSDALRLKRDFNARNVSWNGVRSDPATRAARQVYRELDSAIDRTVPGAQELNQRISSLIPVKDRGIMKAAGPGVAGNVADTITRPTGAITSAAALAGGHTGAGLLAKSLLSSPTIQIAIGKGLNLPYALGRSNPFGLMGKTGTVGKRAAQAGLISQLLR